MSFNPADHHEVFICHEDAAKTDEHKIAVNLQSSRQAIETMLDDALWGR